MVGERLGTRTPLETNVPRFTDVLPPAFTVNAAFVQVKFRANVQIRFRAKLAKTRKDAKRLFVSLAKFAYSRETSQSGPTSIAETVAFQALDVVPTAFGPEKDS